MLYLGFLYITEEGEDDFKLKNLKKLVFISSLILFLLIILYIFIKILPKSNYFENSKYVKQIEDVLRIKVKKEGEDPFFVSKDGNVEGLEKIPVNKGVTGLMFNFFKNIPVERVFYPKEDLEEYGLKNPSFIFEVELENEKCFFVVGKKTHDGGSYYIKSNLLKNDGQIAIVESGNIQPILVDKKGYVDLKLIKQFKKTFGEDGEYNGDGLQACVVKGKNLKNPLEFGVDEKGEIFLKSPKDFKMDEEVKNIIVKGPDMLVANEVVCLKPSKEEIEKFGLNSPLQVLEYRIDDVEYVVKIGDIYKVEQIPVNGNEEKKEVETFKYYYVLVDGIDAVYSVPQSSLSCLKLNKK